MAIAQNHSKHCPYATAAIRPTQSLDWHTTSLRHLKTTKSAQTGRGVPFIVQHLCKLNMLKFESGHALPGEGFPMTKGEQGDKGSQAIAGTRE